MKRGLSKRLLAVLLVLSMLVAYALPTYAADGESKLKFEQVSNSLLPSPIKDAAVHNTDAKEYKDTDVVRVSIFLNGKSTLDAGYSTQSIASNAAAMRYQQNLANTQAAVEERINRRLGEELDIVWNLTLVANVISANVEYGKIEAIKNVPGVADVVLECTYEAAKGTESDTAEPNTVISTGMTGATAAWNSGYTGAGSKIAIIDTGLDLKHQSVDAGAFLHAIEGQNVDLMDKSDIEKVLPNLHAVQDITDADKRPTADDLYVNEKVPFGFNYVDHNLNLGHVQDAQGEHGSHVAGIAAANRYIPDGKGGYLDALESAYAAGTAPDAQLLVMKVFGANGGAYDSDYMVAIEDAILLGCDSVNLSLGSGQAGMATNEEYQAILDKLAKSDTVVTISAGNSGYWSEYSDLQGLLHSDDVNWATDGSPGSYANAFTVASVDNNGMVTTSMTVGSHKFTYMESATYGNPPLETLIKNGSATEYDFVLLDSPGAVVDTDAEGNPLVDASGNYTFTQKGTFNDFAKLGDKLKGKIVMCYRGTSSFFVKANLAAQAGAAGVIIVNNQEGVIYLNLTGYVGKVPVVSIFQSDGEQFKKAGTKAQADGLTYYTGKVSVNPTSALKTEPAYYTMSSFSSWGMPGDLSLKPEITAPGGNIYSINGTHYDSESGTIVGGTTSYELMSGTSMAAPQVAGLAAVVQQYIRDNKLSQSDITDRALVQSLLMSTAEPMKDANGNYYPVFQQGAGLANVLNATTASSYVLMCQNATASYADGKVKAELGANTTGAYDFSFTLNNLTEKELAYDLSADVFTQDFISKPNYFTTGTVLLGDTVVTFSVGGKELTAEGLTGYDFDNDGDVDMADAQLLMDHVVKGTELKNDQENANVDKDKDVDTYDVYTLMTMIRKAVVTVPANKSVQVDVHMELSAEKKAALKTMAPNGAYVEGYVFAKSVATTEGVEDVTHSIPVLGYYGNWADPSMFDRTDKQPYLASLHEGDTNYFTDAVLGTMLGDNPVTYDDEYLEDRGAISSSSGIGQMLFTLIRNAGASRLTVKLNDQPILNNELGSIYASYFYTNGQEWRNVVQGLNLGLGLQNVSQALGLAKLPEDTKVEVSFTAVPEYFVKNGKVDWNAAAGKGTTLTAVTHIDDTAPTIKGIIKNEDGSITVAANDNRYIAAILVYPNDGAASPAIVYAPNMEHKGDLIADIPMVDDLTGEALTDDVYMVQLVDYAGNMSTYRLFYGMEATEAVEGVAIETDAVNLVVNNSRSISAIAMPVNLSDRSVTWTSDDPTVATVDENGVVTGVAEGVCIITAASKLDPTKTASCLVTVTKIEETLNGLVWDEEGQIWWSEINTAKLPNYTKLSTDSESTTKQQLSSATYGPDGKLYATSFDTDTQLSNLYTIDETTFEATFIGTSAQVGYTDIAPAPNLMGGALLATYGPYVLLVDPTTGVFAGAWEWCSTSNLVGIAYAGSVLNTNYNQYIDVYYLLDSDGNIYQEAFIDMGGKYYFFNGEEASYAGTIGDAVDTPWFQSLYCAENYLYWSRFNEADNCVELIAVDLNDGNVYSLGNFADGVWPVGGLFELNPTAPAVDTSAALTEKLVNAQLKPVEVVDEIKPIELPESEKSTGSVQSVTTVPADNAEPMHTGDSQWEGNLFENGNYVVQITAQDFDGEAVKSNNGRYTISWDPAVLELEKTLINSEVYASKTDIGSFEFGYADTDAFAADAVVATLVFHVKDNAAFGVEVLHKEEGNDHNEETTPDPLDHEHNFTGIPVDPTCTEPGYTILICTECGYFGIAAGSEVDPTGHDVGDWLYDENGHYHVCSVCGEILDEAAHEYTDVVTAPTCTEKGYTTHTCTECGYSYTDTEVPATGHKVGEWIIDENGHHHVCDVCHEEVDKAEHKYTDTVTAPTCTAEGYTTHTCDQCGYSYTDTKVSATGHKAGDEWKSDENGHYHECANCGTKLDEAGHDYKWVVDKEATATEKGSKHQECKVCGHKTAAVEIPAKGSSAQTGDDSNIWLWVGLLAVASVGLVGVALYSRKRKIAE